MRKFVTLLYFNIVPNQNKLTYSSAGHERILIHRAGSSKVEVVKSGGLILGMIDDIGQYLEDNSLQLEKNDKILLYTDGATEARSPAEEFYGLERLISAFKNHADLPIKQTIDNVYRDIKYFISTRDQYDDITLVEIEKD